MAKYYEAIPHGLRTYLELLCELANRVVDCQSNGGLGDRRRSARLPDRLRKLVAFAKPIEQIGKLFTAD